MARPPSKAPVGDCHFADGGLRVEGWFLLYSVTCRGLGTTSSKESGESGSQQVEFLYEPRQSLLEVLRDVLGWTGTKEGYNDGNCGACAVKPITTSSGLMLCGQVLGCLARQDGNEPLGSTNRTYS